MHVQPISKDARAASEKARLFTHGCTRLHCVLSGCVFFAYCVFADKHSTHRNFECAGALCSVYCVFGCQFVFTPPEILSAVVYCVLRIAYPVHHFESGCVLRIAYCVLRIVHPVHHFECGCVLRIVYCVSSAPF